MSHNQQKRAKLAAKAEEEGSTPDASDTTTSAITTTAAVSRRTIMEGTKLLVKKLTEHATIPTRGSSGAAGYDLYSAYDVKIPAKGKAIVKTDIAVAIPQTCYGRVAPRSGLTVKHFLDVGAGVIDSDYRGNVGVVMFNFNDTDYSVSKGDRVAQLILERIYTPDVQEVEDLEDTARGEGGFGSTGKQ
ncbi:deoxyuridine 5'-triphosphate nucleotidohydrolase [Salpingoeca rosetta]|uniref:Deoxyuridine 5'-triphosphate nucleotidohydrolase n=1 Tax=Salpingoeca rosetta (strain ATCC 50818 / BSB-021) TaxID=946362 RepID=F2U7A4_SALR5|nr:deoxyuridine 5'-triphosphate nucleotidohydrolase [Salpingoeca rosetta]EGD83321.1 deoxyuridine 5'-triphosphate nucleotidohydrolase [Salpingoeca rosetta]|eukprot:XP_004994825.1 deoxyuridine 5'-triphosphate nucleotidohydrolase [Salpingoeca rosetta]